MSTVNNSLSKTKEKETNIVSLIKQSEKQFALALPKHFGSERFTRIALTEVRKNSKLMNCDAKSLLGALMTSAQLGLEPGVLGQAYLIPYGRECQFQISYKGMIELLRRTGQLKDIYAYEVMANDEFDLVYGLHRDLIHKPCMTGDRGDTIGYYSVAVLKDDTIAFEFMTKSEIDKHAKRYSKAYNSSYPTPWKTEFDEMAKKTVIKKMLKFLPVSVELIEQIREKDDIKKEEPKPIIDHKIEVAEEIVAEVEEAPNSTPKTVKKAPKKAAKPVKKEEPKVEPVTIEEIPEDNFVNDLFAK